MAKRAAIRSSSSNAALAADTRRIPQLNLLALIVSRSGNSTGISIPARTVLC
jgi:hypothetical protein